MRKVKVTLRAPGSAHVGSRFSLRVKVRRACKRQKVVFQERVSGSWKSLGKKRLNRRGVAKVSRVHFTLGTPVFRAVVKRKGVCKAKKSRTRSVELYYLTRGEFGSEHFSGPMMTQPPEGVDYPAGLAYWHPDLGSIMLEDLEAAVAASSSHDVHDVVELGVTGPPDSVRIILSGSFYTPSSGLSPAHTTFQLFVYNPFTDKVEQTITTAPPDETWSPSGDVVGGDGNVFVLNVGRNSEDWVVAYDMTTGAEVWAKPGHVESSSRREGVGVGERGSVTIFDGWVNGDGPGPCVVKTLTAVDTGAVLHAFDPYRVTSSHGAGWTCDHFTGAEGLIGLGGDGREVIDSLSGAKVNVPVEVFSNEVGYAAGTQYDRAAGLVAWKRRDGAIAVWRSDGTPVYELPASEAGPVGAHVEELAGNSLWLGTTDELLHVDLTTAALTPVTEVPPLLQTVLSGHWSFYSDGYLRRDRY